MKQLCIVSLLLSTFLLTSCDFLESMSMLSPPKTEAEAMERAYKEIKRKCEKQGGTYTPPTDTEIAKCEGIVVQCGETPKW